MRVRTADLGPSLAAQPPPPNLKHMNDKSRSVLDSILDDSDSKDKDDFLNGNHEFDDSYEQNG